MTDQFRFTIAAFLVLALSACGGDESPVTLDAAALDALRDYAMDPEMNTQSVVVTVDGAVAAEWYAPGFDEDSWTTSWSVAKSFTATLIGIALHEGLLTSIDEPMTTYLPEWIGTEAEGITIAHVLGMATGFDWQESIETPTSVLGLGLSSDQLGFAVDQDVLFAPGDVWTYSSGNTMLLSTVIAQITGMKASEYARLKLAEPLGFDRFEWWEDGAGNTITYCCIDATARDFAKLGELYLQRGTWNGQRIFDESWADDVIVPQQATNPSYGLSWWLNLPGGDPDRPTVSRSLLSAQGFDGQRIFVFPEQRVVVTRNGLFIRPEGPAVAPTGLADAGMYLLGLGETGSTGPGEAWSDTTFLELVEAAMVE